jgi:hypothetical protein
MSFVLWFRKDEGKNGGGGGENGGLAIKRRAEGRKIRKVARWEFRWWSVEIFWRGLDLKKLLPYFTALFFFLLLCCVQIGLGDCGVLRPQCTLHTPLSLLGKLATSGVMTFTNVHGSNGKRHPLINSKRPSLSTSQADK